MLLDYFKQYPTIEEIRQVVFNSLANMGENVVPKHIKLDLKFECDGSIGFEYYQLWISNLYHLKYRAFIKDIRDRNAKIMLECIGLSS